MYYGKSPRGYVKFEESKDFEMWMACGLERYPLKEHEVQEVKWRLIDSGFWVGQHV